MSDLKNLSVEELLDKLVECGQCTDVGCDKTTESITNTINDVKEEIMRRFYAGEPMK